jgi:menaquinol-cytochrome c reductase iron-sulfur subunit
MSEHMDHNDEERESKTVSRREMSRRQFLTYALGGTTAFMAAGVTLPMVRFAVDPILKPKQEANFVKVVEEAKITDQPQSFEFVAHQVDGWYESDPIRKVWIVKKNGQIFALNPTCKHLGCQVEWNGSADYKDQYYCPCHGAHYTIEGKQLAVADAPLDEHAVKVENGFVYVGELHPNTIVK